MRRIGNASLQRFAKLSLRQRLALIVMIALLMVALAYVIILLPQQQKRAKYQRDLQESQGAVLQLKARLAALTSARQRGVLRNGGGGGDFSRSACGPGAFFDDARRLRFRAEIFAAYFAGGSY